MNENEKTYKALTMAGAGNIALGIVVLVTGITCGVLAIISGARILRYHILRVGRIEERLSQNAPGMQQGHVRGLYCLPDIFPVFCGEHRAHI